MESARRSTLVVLVVQWVRKILLVPNAVPEGYCVPGGAVKLCVRYGGPVRQRLSPRKSVSAANDLGAYKTTWAAAETDGEVGDKGQGTVRRRLCRTQQEFFLLTEPISAGKN